MTAAPHDVFLDSSALFAAILSATGEVRQILRLGEAGQVRLLVTGAARPFPHGAPGHYLAWRHARFPP